LLFNELNIAFGIVLILKERSAIDVIFFGKKRLDILFVGETTFDEA